MRASETRYRMALQAVGVCSPYAAVGVGVFVAQNALAAMLFYHLAMVLCIVGIRGQGAFAGLGRGLFDRVLGPLIAAGGVAPGEVIHWD